MRVSRRSVLSAATFGVAGILAAQEQTAEKLAPYFPTPRSVVEKMLKLADVKPSDTVYDLGSGDGRIVLMAAEKFGAKAVGVEYDTPLVLESRMAIKRKKLEKKASIIHGDMLVQDYSPATVVTVYLLPTSNDKMRPILEKQLKPGTRIVCHDFEFSGWTPAKTETIEDDGEGRSHTLFLYIRK
ncbi:MAG: 50S ribosomal protein L11 methyltransferase [Bryobacterales bacterium]|nr:50S ribosomal protein L11 methyltransferase [Bryobacterales bacterium]